MKLKITASLKLKAGLPSYLKPSPDGEDFYISPENVFEFDSWIQTPMNVLQLKHSGKQNVVNENTGEVYWEHPSSVFRSFRIFK